MKKITINLLIYVQLFLLTILFILLLSSNSAIHVILMFAGLSVFIVYNILQMNSAKDQKFDLKPGWKYIIFFISMAVTVIIAFQIKPMTDQWLLVQTAQEIRNYNYSAFAEGGYLFRYPFQSGLVLFYYFVSFLVGESNYIALQLVNVMAAIYMMFVLERFANLIIDKKYNITNKLYFAFLFCYPLYIYLFYVYGTLLGFSLGIGALYQLLSYKKNGKKREAAISILLLTFSVAIKPNGKIILVAAILYIVYWWLQKEMKTRNAFGLIIAYVVMGYLCNQIITLCIFRITGITLSKGMPMLGWIAMGLSEGGEAPGSYSGFVVNTFIKSGYNYDLTSQYALQEILSRLQYFGKNLKDAIRFFSEKTIYQWGDATFNAYKILNYGNQIHESSVLYKIISSSFIAFYSKVYQIGIFAGSFLFFWLNRKKVQIEEMMLAVVFIGGFVFHLVWESSPSYTVTYFFLLIPYAVMGYRELAVTLQNIHHKKIKQTDQEKNKITLVTVVLLFIGVFIFYIGAERETKEVATFLENGYYHITCGEETDKSISFQNERIQLTNVLEEKDLTISRNRSNGLYQIRFYPSGELLGINNGEVISYIDSIVNMEYTEVPNVRYEWSILEREEGGYFIVMDQLALTYDQEYNEIKVEEFTQEEDQIWLLKKEKE